MESIGGDRIHPAVDRQGLREVKWSGYVARSLTLWGQCLDWLAQCQYTETG